MVGALWTVALWLVGLMLVAEVATWVYDWWRRRR